ncbi:hypothetical protein [Ferrigenium sp. UT5]|uniref:hypothetical protein n=1 Tax=Ferrigenium sp. UT5 TaxID=3242105 RepID=UPI0035543CCC
MSNQLLTGLVMGKLLGGGDKTAEIAAEGEAQRARADAAYSHNTALAIVGALNRVEGALKEEREAKQGWRQYAARLRTNLEARKMSEAALLEALKQENVKNPLATEEGFKEHFQAELAKQYGVGLDADPQTFDAREEATMLKQRTEGRGAVE